MKKVIFAVLFTVVALANVNAQDYSEIIKSSNVKVEKLPEYLIITSQNTKLLGGTDIQIDSKKSKYQTELENLVVLLQNRKKLHIRNQTDLLNAMSVLGFELIDTYNARQVENKSDNKIGDDIASELLSGGNGTFRINMIFRKKEKFRN